MTNPRHCRVEVKRDHLSKIAAGSPKTALAEIIWNSLDADAMNISVSFTTESAQIVKITVSDDGTGISYDIEKSPQDLQKILTEVLNLPKPAREQLAELLDGTLCRGS